MLVCDDQALFREGLRLALAQLYPDLIWLEASSGEAVEPLLRQNTDVDLVVLALALPGGGLAVLEMLRREFPALPVVVVSASENPAELRRALEGGASGYLSKSTSGPVLRAAVQLVLAGGIYVPPALIGRSEDLLP